MMEPVEKKRRKKNYVCGRGEGKGRDLSNGPTYNIVDQWFSTFFLFEEPFLYYVTI
jgi:hypothetical protein